MLFFWKIILGQSQAGEKFSSTQSNWWFIFSRILISYQIQKFQLICLLFHYIFKYKTVLNESNFNDFPVPFSIHISAYLPSKAFDAYCNCTNLLIFFLILFRWMSNALLKDLLCRPKIYQDFHQPVFHATLYFLFSSFAAHQLKPSISQSSSIARVPFF